MSLLKRLEQGQRPEAETSPSRLQEIRVKRQAPVAGSRDAYQDLKGRVQNKLIAELDPSIDVTRTGEVRTTIEELFETILTEENIVLSRNERRRLFEQIVAEILGLGPLEPLLADDTITEVMVNGPKNIYIERYGKIERANATFENDEHLMRIIDRIVLAAGPAHRREFTNGGRASARWFARERCHPAHFAGRPYADHPQVFQNAVDRSGPDQFRDHHPRGGRVLYGPASSPRSTSSFQAAPVPARRRCSTCSRVLFRTTSGSSPSRTRPSCSSDRSTW